MKNKRILFIVLLYAIIILQTTLMDYIKIWNVKANIVLIFIICIALIRGGLEGTLFGLSAGLLQDIISGQSIGPYALLGFLIGFALWGFNKRFYKDNIFMCIIITFAISIIYEIIFILSDVPLEETFIVLNMYKTDVLVEALFNVIMCMPIYILTLKINKKIDFKEKKAVKY